MTVPQQIARHLREVYFGGNWTSVNLQEMLADVTWQQATSQVDGFHSIATLVFHTGYFVRATLEALQGGSLNAPESESFYVPPIGSEQDWERFLARMWDDAELLAQFIEQLPESRLAEPFVEPRYGDYYRCLHGPIEHCHYHLGQIAMLKRMLAGDRV